MHSSEDAPLLKALELFTWDDYEKLKQEQGGVCAICRRQPPAKRRLAIDHCHKRGFVRGLLCTRCNLLLPFLEDTFVRKQAVAYLERAEQFSEVPLKLSYTLTEFLNTEFPEPDWRRVVDRETRDLLLDGEVGRMCYGEGKNVRQIAKELGITRRKVESLMRGDHHLR